MADVRQTDGTSNSPIRSFCYKQRPTYYTPPSQDRTRCVIPPNLFGKLGSKRKYPEQEKLTIDEDERSTRSRNTEVYIDEYGWFQLENGNWKNQLSGEVSAERPY